MLLPIRRSAYGLSILLAIIAGTTGLVMLLNPSVLRGPAVMNGSAQGTAAVLVFIDLPLLLGAMWFAARGSVRALPVWLGAVAFAAYQAILFLFLTPFNSLFLLNVAMMGLCFWSAVSLLSAVDVRWFARQVSSDLPARGIAAYILVIVVLNALLWLRSIIPALGSSGTPEFLQGTGVATNAVFIQDLGFWLPLMAVAAVWLWQRRPWGLLITSAVLVTWVVESISIAVDQLMGHLADPSSTLVSVIMTPVFLVLALIGLIPVGLFYRAIRSRDAISREVTGNREALRVLPGSPDTVDVALDRR